MVKNIELRLDVCRLCDYIYNLVAPPILLVLIHLRCSTSFGMTSALGMLLFVQHDISLCRAY